jgi:hypothetical protein
VWGKETRFRAGSSRVVDPLVRGRVTILVAVAEESDAVIGEDARCNPAMTPTHA